MNHVLNINDIEISTYIFTKKILKKAHVYKG